MSDKSTDTHYMEREVKNIVLQSGDYSVLQLDSLLVKTFSAA